MRLGFFVTVFYFAAACSAIGAESPKDLITKGDAFDVRFQAAEALQFYLAAEELQPANVRVLVRITR